MREQVLVVSESGDQVTTLYDDHLPDLGRTLEIKRASYVEYEQVPGSGGWDVEIALGKFAGLIVLNPNEAILAGEAENRARNGAYRGFKTRQEALEVEVAFLNKHVLGA